MGEERGGKREGGGEGGIVPFFLILTSDITGPSHSS
jgi:hypothetical protein